MYIDFRSDGWPFCPFCKEDELYSVEMMTFASELAKGKKTEAERPTPLQCMRGVMRCYRCGWGSDILPRRTWFGCPYVVVEGKWPMEMVLPRDPRNKTGHIEIQGQSFHYGYSMALESIFVPLPIGPQGVTASDLA